MIVLRLTPGAGDNGTVVYRTETIDNNLNPTWKTFTLGEDHIIITTGNIIFNICVIWSLVNLLTSLEEGGREIQPINIYPGAQVVCKIYSETLMFFPNPALFSHLLKRAVNETRAEKMM